MVRTEDAPVHLPLARLRRISPSRYSGLRGCALREVWTAGDAGPLLATSPNARLGTAIHALFEMAGKRALGADPARVVEGAWDSCIEFVEAAMRASPLDRALVPLERSARDYGARRERALRRAVQIAIESMASSAIRTGNGITHDGVSGTRASFERWVETADKTVGGKIDHVISTASGSAIVEYKTGRVTDDGDGEPVIREAYRIQMLLYAALYWASEGIWPERLELWPLEGVLALVPFDPDTCQRLLEDAEATLMRVDEMVDAINCGRVGEEVLATPAPLTCRACGYRPACRSYLRAREQDDGDGWPGDVWGTVGEIRTLGNGRCAIDLHAVFGGEAVARVRGIVPDPQRHPVLPRLRLGDRIGCFNARTHASGTLYDESPYTVLYRWDGDDLAAGLETDRSG